jgi:hypothetical protein
MSSRREPVFFSFDYDHDVFRVQQVKQMGAIEDSGTLVSSNAWEQVKTRGDAAIRKWIDENMAYRRCVIVLIGRHTSESRWVNYEIQKASTEGRGLFGIYIHNLKCPVDGICTQGRNPFAGFVTNDRRSRLDTIIPAYDPPSSNAYGYIAANIENWIDSAVRGARPL